ncbi:methyl-accepting chemotaxis protein [Aureimonas sp. SA4125]|uniref:methyl-accepting chemotaxis protein n=1 Tax=Aureimonas sp. SA4125 TaxID=2826993 RepID=UPI001E756600|nr:PAS domain-containing methyl-accepting chemotaxis protein [Aureimonas sp. SA4125]BDA83136.1 methyl-accepting chemotaxis protein [Aureimonas sp. SA4125]
MTLFASRSDDILRALGRSLGVIEFDPSGKVLAANANFCALMGYEPSEIIGQKHRIFVEPGDVISQDYQSFWPNLADGSFLSDEFKRIGKGGKTVWIQASYNPITNSKGRVYRVVKFATDITDAKRRAIEDAGKLKALSDSQAIIEFTPDGDILSANENFLLTVGYSLDEVKGRHHRIFVDPAYAATPAYGAFWDELRAGRFQAADFKRFGKGGKAVWIQASYNPIRDENGVVVKVVKFATDLSDRMMAVSCLGEALGRLADGDLAQRLERPFIPSLESLRENFNASLEKLQLAMSSVSRNADVIHSGSAQIMTASEDLSQRAAQQAAALEEASATLSEMTSTVRDSSLRAEEVGSIVSQTKQDAEKSGTVVEQAVSAMAAIERSSEEIGKIIGVIDEIAFQTNLLALNAGVEAARAGEAGRGFAVVAQEVRGLAQRSAEAAKQIKDLISMSGKQVDSGVNLVGQAGTALRGIVASVVTIDALIATIVEASRSQTSGLAEINGAVGTLDQGTQQNAAMVEQSTAASNELASEAAAMHALLSHFKLGAAGGRRPAVHALRDRVAQAYPARRKG